MTNRQTAPKAKRTSGRELDRRKVLKGAAATAGLAAGSKILGAPTLWAQNLKDVTIVHTGMSYSTIIDIATQATQDLGFTVEMAVTDQAGSAAGSIG